MYIFVLLSAKEASWLSYPTYKHTPDSTVDSLELNTRLWTLISLLEAVASHQLDYTPIVWWTSLSSLSRDRLNSVICGLMLKLICHNDLGRCMSNLVWPRLSVLSRFNFTRVSNSIPYC